MPENENSGSREVILSRTGDLARRSAGLIQRGLDDITDRGEPRRALESVGAGDILEAARIGDVDRVRAILRARPASVHSRDDDGWTPLHWASCNGHTDVVETLLTFGALIDARSDYMSLGAYAGWGVLDPRGRLRFSRASAPLHLAAVAGHAEVAALLCARGADREARDGYGAQALHHAAWCGRVAVVERFIASGADVDARDDEGRTPLGYAVYAETPAVMELLIAGGADVDAKDDDGNCPLSYLGDAQEDEAALLIASGADVNALSTHTCTPGWTLLHDAAFRGRTRLAKLLISNGADVNAREEYSGTTPLSLAIAMGRVELAELLRHSGGVV